MGIRGGNRPPLLHFSRIFAAQAAGRKNGRPAIGDTGPPIRGRVTVLPSQFATLCVSRPDIPEPAPGCRTGIGRRVTRADLGRFLPNRQGVRRDHAQYSPVIASGKLARAAASSRQPLRRASLHTCMHQQSCRRDAAGCATPGGLTEGTVQRAWPRGRPCLARPNAWIQMLMPSWLELRCPSCRKATNS